MDQKNKIAFRLAAIILVVIVAGTRANLFVGGSSGTNTVMRSSGREMISGGAGKDRIDAMGGTNIVAVANDNFLKKSKRAA